MQKKETLTEYFNATKATIIFILLHIGTLGFYYYYWLYTTAKKLNINNTTRLILIALSITAWNEMFMSILRYFSVNAGNDFYIVLGIFTIFGYIIRIGVFIIGIVFSLQIEKALRTYIEQSGKQPQFATWASVIFQGFYLYYALRINDESSVPQKIEQNQTPTASLTSELEKLNKLKNDGILTQEEFDAQKNKLLNP
jgi:hypothetical protein